MRDALIKTFAGAVFMISLQQRQFAQGDVVHQVASLYTPLPGNATNADYRRWSPPTKDWPSWAVDDIGKPCVPKLSKQELREARYAYRITPFCMRWALRFAWAPLSEANKSRAFVLYRDAGQKGVGSSVLYFTHNRAIVAPVHGDYFLITANGVEDPMPRVVRSCDPLNNADS